MSDATRLVLAIETSGPEGGVALVRGGETCEVLGEAAFSEQRRQAAELAPLMKSLLESAQVGPDLLDAVAVSIGPGSYTGLRVGVSAAKTFCWASGLAFLPVCSLEALACDVLAVYADAVERAGGRIAVCRDAFSAQVYVRSFTVSADGSLAAATAAQILAPQALLKMMAAPALIVGSGISRCREVLGDSALAGYDLRESPQTARAATVGRLAAAGRRDEVKGRDIHGVCPVYLRKSLAELQP